MGKISSVPNTSSDGTVIYDTNVIRQVAGKIIADVGITRPVHDSTWNTIQNYLDGEKTWLAGASSEDSYEVMANRIPDAYSYIKHILEPHEKRLSASFDLQLQVADALFTLADLIDEAEKQIADGFQPDPAPTPRPTHGRTF